jgi:hypothetical protein
MMHMRKQGTGEIPQNTDTYHDPNPPHSKHSNCAPGNHQPAVVGGGRDAIPARPMKTTAAAPPATVTSAARLPRRAPCIPGNNNHDMHRNAANMATACNLCHTGDSSTRVPTFIKTSNGTANNPGLGCSGCHVASGLQLHHINNGVSECLDCHDLAAAPAETVKPPYYDTVDTKAKNPGNTVLTANTNENWSVGDFLGLGQRWQHSLRLGGLRGWSLSTP